MDHLDLFRAKTLFEDRYQIAVAKERFEDLVFVWIHGTLHDIFAKTPGGIYQHRVRKTCFGVDGEHHA